MNSLPLSWNISFLETRSAPKDGGGSVLSLGDEERAIVGRESDGRGVHFETADFAVSGEVPEANGAITRGGDEGAAIG